MGKLWKKRPNTTRSPPKSITIEGGRGDLVGDESFFQKSKLKSRL